MPASALRQQIPGEWEAVESSDRRHRRTVLMIVGAGILALLLRFPFVFTGLSPDEGGYAYVARQWSHGAQLYGADWLDRPQGLLLTYRFLLWLNGSGWTIRVGMMVAGATVSLLLGVIGWRLAGRRTGVLAAFLYAIIGVAPHLEGTTLNGELLASVPATAAVAAALLWRGSRTAWWLLAAGASAGVALTMKQSGVDGVVAGLTIVLATNGPRLRNAITFLVAVAVPVGACVADGWYLGLSRYWSAMAGYQIDAMGTSASNLGTRWHLFAHSFGVVALDLTLVATVAAFGFRVLSRFGRLVVGGWLAACFVGVNLGGAYWPHYYMQPLVPLTMLAAVAAGAYSIRLVRLATVAIVALPTVIWLATLVVIGPQERQEAIPYYGFDLRSEQIASAVDELTAPSQRIYVFVASPAIYFLAHREASYPYLWGYPIRKIPSALPLLRSMLAGADRPAVVVMQTPNPDSIDPTGVIGRDLRRYYESAEIVGGVRILRADVIRPRPVP
ncbi:MAG TPA: glycosyltransferase family 39 protein [Micromonosporaceae bacterium]